MDVSCVTPDFLTFVPILYSGCILMNIKYKGQSDRSILSVYTCLHSTHAYFNQKDKATVQFCRSIPVYTVHMHIIIKRTKRQSSFVGLYLLTQYTCIF